MQQTNETALLVMDMQLGILNNYPQAVQVVNKAAAAAKAARRAGLPVIYVHLKLRPGLQEVNIRNKMIGGIRERLAGSDVETFAKLHPHLDVQPQDIIVEKKRVSAFTGSDLEVVLRSQGIGHLVLAGVSTSGVVLSTLREAADKDYQITVLEDACLDPDPAVHEMLTTKVFLRQAEVTTVADWKP